MVNKGWQIAFLPKSSAEAFEDQVFPSQIPTKTIVLTEAHYLTSSK